MGERSEEELLRFIAALQQQRQTTTTRRRTEESEEVPVIDLSEDLNLALPQESPLPTNNEAAKTLIDLLSKGLPGLSNNDGDPSPNKGPCKCGYRHWLEGKEYDYVFKIETTKGGLILGFNANDNPFTVAGDFIAKHRLNERSLDDTRLISAIANEILDRTQQAHGGGDSTTTNPNFTSSWNPYQAHTTLAPAGTHSMLNPNTGKWESVVSPLEMRSKVSSEEGEKKQHHLSEERKKLRLMKEQKEREKERIRLQIQQSRQEKLQEERKREEERRMKKATISQGGVLTWQNPGNTPSADPKDVQIDKKPEYGNEVYRPEETSNIENAEDGEKEASDESTSDISSDEDSEDEEEQEFERLLDHARAEFKASQVTQKSRVVGLASIREPENKEETTTPTRKESWLEGGLPLLNYKYQTLGELKFIGALDSSGFAPEEIQHFVRILRILRNRAAQPAPNESPTSKTAFSWGKGQSLRSSATQDTGALITETQVPVANSTARALVVDRSVPMTSIAVRLQNGQRLLVECNLSHTIADLHSHIDTHAPPTQPYELVSAFPKRVYSNLNMTIEEAGLANASLTVSNK